MDYVNDTKHTKDLEDKNASRIRLVGAYFFLRFNSIISLSRHVR